VAGGADDGGALGRAEPAPLFVRLAAGGGGIRATIEKIASALAV